MILKRIGSGDMRVSTRERIDSNFTLIEECVTTTEDKLLGWEDLRFPAISINPIGLGGAAGVEALSPYLGCLLFDQNSIESCAGQAQFPHSKKLDTMIIPHVHWTPTNTNTGSVLWRLEYIMANKGTVFPVSYTVLNVLSQASGVANTHQTAYFPQIDTTGMDISAMMMWKLSRIASDVTDTYNTDARLLEFDIHYLKDEVGSTSTDSK